MKKILYLTNFTETARKAICSFIQVYHEKFVQTHDYILLNTWKQPHAGRFQMINLDEILAGNSATDLEAEINSIREKTGFSDLNIKPVSKKGDVVDVVKKMEEEDEFDLVVIGTKGAGILREVLVGSTTSRLVRLIRTPVLVIPETIEFTSPERIVFATDIEECRNREQFERIVNMVRLFMAEFMILHIYADEKPPVAYFEDCMSKYLKGVNYSFHYIQHVDVARGILTFSKNMQAGLLSMIEKKGNLLAKLFRQSVSEKITLSAELPLLIIHE